MKKKLFAYIQNKIQKLKSKQKIPKIFITAFFNFSTKKENFQCKYF